MAKKIAFNPFLKFKCLVRCVSHGSLTFNDFLIWDQIELKFGGNIYYHNKNQYRKNLCKMIKHAKVINEKPPWLHRKLFVCFFFSKKADCSKLLVTVQGCKFPWVKNTICIWSFAPIFIYFDTNFKAVGALKYWLKTQVFMI